MSSASPHNGMRAKQFCGKSDRLMTLRRASLLNAAALHHCSYLETDRRTLEFCYLDVAVVDAHVAVAVKLDPDRPFFNR